MKDSVSKAMKKHTMATGLREQQLQSRDQFDKELQGSMKKRKTLEFLCNSILKKNHDLYLQHETMLDEERKQRADLAENFQSRMAQVTQEINDLKETRTQEIENNQNVR